MLTWIYAGILLFLMGLVLLIIVWQQHKEQRDYEEKIKGASNVKKYR